jgi:hypothetical protein
LARTPFYDLRTTRRRGRELAAIPRPIPTAELALFHDRGRPAPEPRRVALDCLPALFTRLEGTTLRRWAREGAAIMPAIYRELAPIAYQRQPAPRDAAQSFDG